MSLYLARLKEISPTHAALCKDCGKSTICAEALARDFLALFDSLAAKDGSIAILTRQKDEARARLEELQTSTRSSSGDLNPVLWEAVR